MTPTNVITVICDARNMKAIRIACRCGRQWTERIPQELHDSDMIAQFECTQCGRYHLLKNHVLKSFSKEEYHDQFERSIGESRFDVSADQTRYDA